MSSSDAAARASELERLRNDEGRRASAPRLSRKAMAFENLQLVRDVIGELGTRRFQLGRLRAPQIEFVAVDGPTPGSWAAIAGVRDAFVDQLRARDQWRIQSRAYREIDPGRILVLTPVEAEGKHSGLPVTNDGATVFELQAGKVRRILAHCDRRRALNELALENGTSD